MDGSRSVGEVTGAILAGGHARRFHGRSKATLFIGGQRIVDRQLAALRPVTTQQIIVANDPAPFAGLGVEVVSDLVADAGPIGGLLTALSRVRAGRALVLACDLPFVHAAFLRALIEWAPLADIVVPRTLDGLHPLCAVYAASLLPLVQAQIDRGELALHQLLDRARTEVVDARAVAPFDPDGRLLANVNTPADYDMLAPDRHATDAPFEPQ